MLLFVSISYNYLKLHTICSPESMVRQTSSFPMSPFILQTLENDSFFLPPLRESVGVMPSEEHTSIELAGTDRPGLLSEVCAVLADLRCNVVNAEIWTHNSRAAAVVHVADDSTGCAIKDPNLLSTIKELLCNVLK